MRRDVSDGKRLAVFLDGTWNTVGDNTNVWRLKALCAERGADQKRQLTYYDVGVNGFFGGMVGKGLLRNITEAYEWLVDNHDDGDEIYIFGFSRGAYTARSLAGMIAICGLITRGAPLGVQQIYQRYRTEQRRTVRKLIEEHANGTLKDPTLEERWMIRYSRPVDIKMIGVWDTVGSHGVPWFSIQGISRSSFSFLQTGLRIPIQNGYHALAIDEHRKAFSPTLWTVKRYDDPTRLLARPRSVDNVEQRWFVGSHANVGGGYSSDPLAQRPLAWIASKAIRHGLTLHSEIDIDEEHNTAEVKNSLREFMYGLYENCSHAFNRPIGEAPRRGFDYADQNVNETIDYSVFNRWRNDPSYRPRNLQTWAKRHEVKPANLRSSVLADSPSTPAPD